MNGESEFDVIAIGDTTQDIFLKMHEASVQCDLDGKNCKIAFDYAEKIAVDQKTDIPAVGNAANHAIGVARLGLKAAIYTVVGKDDQGEKAKQIFEENNVSSEYVVLDEKHGTNLSIVINFRSERTIFVYHEPREYQVPNMGEAQWLYLTSASGDGVKILHEQVLEYMNKNQKVKLAFNPGTHQIHLGKDALMPILSRTDLLFLNREEAARVLEVETHEIPELMNMYHKLGISHIVITDGPKGAYASDGKKILYAGVFDGPVVERTGAGDSFGSGFLGALIKGESMEDAMMWGNANSTSVVQYVGAREGLLTEESIKKLIEENSDVKAKEFNAN